MPNRKKYSSLKIKSILIGTAFVAPWIIGFIVFTLYPVIVGVQLSLNAVTIKPGVLYLQWAGKEYYNYALNVSTSFKLDLGASVMMICCSVPVVLTFSLIVAIMLNNDYKGRGFFRTVFFMPVVIMSGPVISKLLTGNTVNFTEEGSQIVLFLSNLPILGKPCLYVLDNLVLILWFSGVQILIFLSGLQKISPSLYEAADIDGAGAWEKFWKITLPHIVPLAMICAVYTVVDISNYSGLRVNSDISDNIFNTSMMYSLSAAMSWIYFIVVLLILAVVFLLFKLIGRRSK